MFRQFLAAGLPVLGITTFSALSLEAKAASFIVSPVSATASSTTPGGYGIGNTINQSGLSAGFISGVTDFDTYIAGNPTHTVFANFEWFGAAGTNSGVVNYDLGASYSINAFALWNEESSGIGLFDLLASTDGTTYSTIISAISPPDYPLASYGASVFSFSTANARYFRLNLSGCPQPNPGSYQSCAIGEVAFRSQVSQMSQVPGPLPILGAAVGFGYTRKIRSRIQAAG